MHFQADFVSQFSKSFFAGDNLIQAEENCLCFNHFVVSVKITLQVKLIYISSFYTCKIGKCGKKLCSVMFESRDRQIVVSPLSCTHNERKSNSS